ncbi:menaquinone biosynthetic enzyme MqnA/MqnD family protein [Cohnella thailandensis]|uniref:Chorismate dehydratase n=1 Tax=Cohnella thailandensis TaxID=557557 RepID=A0A841SZ02_9BACL|nr:menaquinone biosynthesis protein [Cohnella thailandensis]MBB6635388.1 menaquinone biosynthesis protein [Cohnella thailandensis]MBP1974768.1 chorismate dehydratase [Cohnella thailandensis]
MTTLEENSRLIRIGRIDYANVWPVFHGFDEKKLDCDAEVVYGMPAELNRKLREGEIDVAAISSFAYGMNSDDYLLLPDLSVSAAGAVQSLLLFLKSPLEKVRFGKIMMSSTSATTVNLLKIVMERFYGGKPEYEAAEPNLHAMLESADAALLIGDHAIRASWENHGYRVLDLGEIWRLWTGLGMTFAVWAVRRDAAKRHPDAIASIYRELASCKRRNLADREPIVREAVRRIGGTPDYWNGYFDGLSHDFGPSEQAGLNLYFQYARELGLLDGPVGLERWPESVHA